MVSQFGSLGYTIMGKTADLTVVQKTIIDTLQELSTTEVRPLSKAQDPQLLPRPRSVGCPQLQVCVHLDGLNAEHKFHYWLYSV